MNPLYTKLAQIAYNTVLQTMMEGEKKHGANGWKEKDVDYHFAHALEHLANWELQENEEDNLAHAITRLTMIKYLEDNHE